jgi:hypothetical protein
MKTYLPVQSLFADGDIDLPRMRRLLSGLAALPPETPGKPSVLTDIAALCAGKPGTEPGGAASGGPVRRGLNRRYLRIRFVQNELERLDFDKAGSDVMFNDFVFDQIDFSAYKKISEEDYSLYSPEGLEDFDASFFVRNFRLSREKIQALLDGAYTRIGGFYYLRRENMLFNPLLMSVMRSLQTSLDFTSLFTREAIRKECRAVLGEDGPDRLFTFLLRALHGVSVIHPDGMKTYLSALEEEKTVILKGTFYPHGKAYTMRLCSTTA